MIHRSIVGPSWCTNVTITKPRANRSGDRGRSVLRHQELARRRECRCIAILDLPTPATCIGWLLRLSCFVVQATQHVRLLGPDVQGIAAILPKDERHRDRAAASSRRAAS